MKRSSEQAGINDSDDGISAQSEATKRQKLAADAGIIKFQPVSGNSIHLTIVFLFTAQNQADNAEE